MKFIFRHKTKFTFLLILITVIIHSCSFDTAIPVNQINSFFVNPKLKDYEIKTIALLPMENDDTTDLGTYYSTNYFYNLLSDSIAINLIDINKILPSDSSSIAAQIKMIVENKYIDTQAFFNTELGKFLMDNNCDALILGTVNDYNFYYNTWYNKFGQIYISSITVCNFSYLMVSLEDGTIVWGANIDGVEEFVDLKVKDASEYNSPPLDMAISNGIHLLIERLVEDRILVYKVK